MEVYFFIDRQTVMVGYFVYLMSCIAGAAEPLPAMCDP